MVNRLRSFLPCHPVIWVILIILIMQVICIWVIWVVLVIIFNIVKTERKNNISRCASQTMIKLLISLVL